MLTRVTTVGILICYTLIFYFLYGVMLIHPKHIYWSLSNHYEIGDCKSVQDIGPYMSLVWRDLDIICRPQPNQMVEIYGAFINAIDIKSTNGLVKLDNNYVSLEPVSLKNIPQKATNVVQLKQYYQIQNIPLIYVQCPIKIHKNQTALPRGIVDKTNPDLDLFLENLRKQDVETIDLRDIFIDNPEEHYANYYWSDHHWKSKYALLACEKIVHYLHDKHQWQVDFSFFNSTNFVEEEISIAPSELVRVGKYYVQQDKPHFLKYIGNNSCNSTPLESSDLNNNLNLGDDVRVSWYSHRPELKKTVVILGDSYTGYFSPYFSNFCNTLIVIDPRRSNVSLKETINQLHPDLILVFYWGLSLTNEKCFMFD